MVYNKLVRDKIPQIIRAQGEIPQTRQLTDEEYLPLLEQKLDEEVREYHADRTVEELADILEVVFALAQAQGVSKETLMESYREKHHARGGFREKCFLVSKEALAFAVADESDVPIIYGLSKALIDAYEDVASIPYEKVLAWVRKKIIDKIGQYTRVLKDGKIVGYYRLHEEEDAWELDDLYVLEQYRGRGIGSAVLAKCLKDAGGPVFLYVFKRNVGAVRLYERMGFRKQQDVGQSRMILLWEG